MSRVVGEFLLVLKHVDKTSKSYELQFEHVVRDYNRITAEGTICNLSVNLHIANGDTMQCMWGGGGDPLEGV